jgi:hypothetical protein
MIETAQHLRRHRILRRRAVDATTAGSCGAEFASTSLFPFRGKRLEQRRTRGVTDAAPNLANMSEHRRSNRPARAPARPRPHAKNFGAAKVVRRARPPRLRRPLSPSYQRSRAYSWLSGARMGQTQPRHRRSTASDPGPARAPRRTARGGYRSSRALPERWPKKTHCA